MNGDVEKELCGGVAIPTPGGSDGTSAANENQEIEQRCNSPALNVEEDHMLNGSGKVTAKDSEKMENDVAKSSEKEISDSKEDKCSSEEIPSSVDAVETEADPQQVKDGSLNEAGEAYQSTKGSEAACTDSNQSLPAPASVEPMTREKIKELLLEQVQYFFSRENWSRDPYLLSQMDSDQYVPLYILANCSQFKSITKDHSIILDALKESSLLVQLDEKNTRVRPNYKRCIVLLREIPECTPKEEIEAMFQGGGCPPVVSCEFVHNDFWYVTFESDNDAQKAYTYLRETVKTFKDKPILARMKSKPMSRLGCFSVLPSYGGKTPQGESKDGGAQPPATSGPQMTPGPNPPAPGAPMGTPGLAQGPPAAANVPGGGYAPAGGNQRVFFQNPPNNMNPSYNYNYTGSTQMPAAAYFYPNPMVQWAAPNFYDINGFIQYNGLTPKATFKPPTSTNARYNNNNNNGNNNNNSNGSTNSANNNNRRNKNRDKFDKNEARHLSGGSSSGGGGGGSGQGQPRNNPSSRPPSVPPSSSQDPSASCAQSSQSNNGPASENDGGPNIFAQNDPPPASQSNLYTSFSPPASASAGSGSGSAQRGSLGKLEKKDVSSTSYSSNSPAVPLSSGAATESVVSSASEQQQQPQPMAFTTTSSTNPNVSSSSTAGAGTGLMVLVPSQSTPYNINQQAGLGSMPPTSHYPSQANHSSSIASPHRNGYGGNEQQQQHRESQPQRQIGRGGGGRRRGISRREDEVNGVSSGSGGRGPGMSRGGSNSSGDFHLKNSHHLDAKKPQFELKDTLFPPLPGADEAVVVVSSSSEEKTPEPAPQTPWSGDTQKFSDVMKGTAKPKCPQSSSSTDKEAASEDVSTAGAPRATQSPPIESSTGAPAPSSSSSSKGSSQQSTSHLVSQDTSTSTLSNANASSSSTCSSTTTSTSSTAPGSTTITSTTSSSSTSTAPVSSSSSSSRSERPALIPQREQRAPQRGIVPPNGRRGTEFNPGLGRGGGGGLRRDRDTTTTTTTTNTRFSTGNKENRPQNSGSGGSGSSFRSWREERPDPEGWITKGPRDTRTHRNQHQQQHEPQQQFHHQHRNHQQHHHHHSSSHNFYDNRNNNGKNMQNMVNGDTSSPPLSPKPEVEKKKKKASNSIDLNNEETSNDKQIAPDDNENDHCKENQQTPLPPQSQQPILTDQEKNAINNNGSEHKPSWAKMALASKDEMEKLSAVIKVKDEQERLKNRYTRTQPKVQAPIEKPVVVREREPKPFRRESFPAREREKANATSAATAALPTDLKGMTDRPPQPSFATYRPKESLRPKSPK